MDLEKIYNHVDNTLLSQKAMWSEIKKLCELSIKYKAASVCIPPSYVKAVKEEYKDCINICTVIGFPNGYNTTRVKVFETEDAINNGADEIDMVINLGWLMDQKYNLIEDEIKQIKKACKGKILKVIIETCLLNKEQKIKMCQIVTNAGADYIKTSTGFSTGGATLEDIKIFKENVGDNIKIKAAGGIRDIEAGKKMLEAGADRLGTSKLIKE